MASSRNLAATCLILRAVTAGLLALSVVVMVTNTVKTVNSDGNKDKATFKDFYAFRYLVLASLIVFAYCVLQIIPTIYLLATRKLMLPYPFALYFDSILDTVFAFMLASSASAALAVAVEIKKIFGSFFRLILSDKDEKKLDRFFLKAEAAAALALLAAATMTVLAIISSRVLFKR